MCVLALDLGGTKLATALFSKAGNILAKEIVVLGNRQGKEVGALVAGQAKKFLAADIQPNDKSKFYRNLCSRDQPSVKRHRMGTQYSRMGRLSIIRGNQKDKRRHSGADRQ